MVDEVRSRVLFCFLDLVELIHVIFMKLLADLLIILFLIKLGLKLGNIAFFLLLELYLLHSILRLELRLQLPHNFDTNINDTSMLAFKRHINKVILKCLTLSFTIQCFLFLFLIQMYNIKRIKFFPFPIKILFRQLFSIIYITVETKAFLINILLVKIILVWILAVDRYVHT